MLTPRNYERFENGELADIYDELNIEITADVIDKVLDTKENNIIGDVASIIFLETLDKLGNSTRAINNASKKMFYEMALNNLKSYKKEYDFRGIKLKLNQEQLQVLNRGLATFNGNLKNMTNTVAFASQQSYVDAVDKAFMRVFSGKANYQKAIKDACVDLAEKGITLKDSAGRNVNMKSAVARNIRYGLKQTNRAINAKIDEELGCDGMETTAHFGARLTHQVWQGKRYALTQEGADKYHLPLWETSDAIVELNDFNCRHEAKGVILGVSESIYTKKELKTMQDDDLNEKLAKLKAKQTEKENLERTKKTLEKTKGDFNEEIKKIDEKIKKNARK
jgi:hypothetical protein